MTKSECGFVFGYVNPDSDGVCSSIGYEFYSGQLGYHFKACRFGSINRETEYILRNLKIPSPVRLEKIDPECEIVIVDTHDKLQLPSNINFSKVIEILDHHPSGNVEDFPNARIQNEPVGAVSTLIAERMIELKVAPTENIAGALMSATISNTLNFKAPSTSKRDISAFKWLSNFNTISNEFIDGMFNERAILENRNTQEILLSDYKEFSLSNVHLGISQIETTNPHELLNRSDIEETLDIISKKYLLEYFFVNVVDIVQNRSIIVATDLRARELLRGAIQAKFNGNKAEFSRILLRKTDLTPNIEKWLRLRS